MSQFRLLVQTCLAKLGEYDCENVQAGHSITTLQDDTPAQHSGTTLQLDIPAPRLSTTFLDVPARHAARHATLGRCGRASTSRGGALPRSQATWALARESLST